MTNTTTYHYCLLFTVFTIETRNFANNKLNDHVFFEFLSMNCQYGFVNYKKGVLDSQPQVIKFTNVLSSNWSVLANGRWFSPGTPASSITNTGRHDIAEILLKVALSTINQIKSKQSMNC